MEEIIKKANELGLMIKGTDAFMRLEELSRKLDADDESKKLLEEYAKVMQEFQEKEAAGSSIEVEEKQQIQDLSEKVAENELIKEYIATNSYYLNMIMQIQKVIGEPQGEPIMESKIIKPNNSSKIITDL